MAKNSGGTRKKYPEKKYKNDPILADNFLSGNQQINAYLRNSRYEGDGVLDEDEIKETIDYVDKIFKNNKEEDAGTLYRGVAFRTKFELQDFLDKNIIFTDGVYTDKGFAFTSEKKLYDGYTGPYSVVFEYEGAKGIRHTTFEKGWHSDVLILDRNQPFKVTSVTNKENRYRIKLKKM